MKEKVVALATAIEALSTGPVKVLAREILTAVEDAPIAAAADLVEEVGRLREELRLAKEAARKRGSRQRSSSSTSRPTDPRQVPMFERPVEKYPDVRTDVRTPSLSTTGSDHTNQIQRSESTVRERPPDIEPVVHDPESPPMDFIARAESIRHDLPEAVIRFSWRSFATRNRFHECATAAMAHWENWIRGEDRAKAEKRMYTAFRPPASAPEPSPPSPEPAEDERDVGGASPEEVAPPAPLSTVQRVRAKFGLPAPEPTFATPMDALEALMRLDRDVPEPRSMSA